MSSPLWTIFERDGASVAVRNANAPEPGAGDGETAEIAAWMRPFVTVTTSHTPPNRGWSLLFEARGQRHDDWYPLDIPAEVGEPARRFWFSPRLRRMLIEPQPSGWRAYTAMRAVRSLLKWQLAEAEQHLLFLHGALVGFDGAGAVFLGAKGAGKTTSTLAALLDGATFVANDDVSVRPDGDAGWIGQGWPRAVHVKPESLRAVADKPLPLCFGELRHPANRKLAEAYADRPVTDLAELGLRGVGLAPAEVARVCGANLAASMPVRAVFLVAHADQPDDRPRVTRLSPAAATAAVAENLLDTPEPIEPYWVGLFTEHAIAARHQAIDCLVNQVPVYRLTQPLARAREATGEVRAVLATARVG